MQYQWVSANAIVVITLKAAIISRAFPFLFFNSFILLVYFCCLIVSGKVGTPCSEPGRRGKNWGNEAIQTNSTIPAREISGGI